MEGDNMSVSLCYFILLFFFSFSSCFFTSTSLKDWNTFTCTCISIYQWIFFFEKNSPYLFMVNEKMFVQEILHNSYNRKSFVEHDIWVKIDTLFLAFLKLEGKSHSLKQCVKLNTKLELWQ